MPLFRVNFETHTEALASSSLDILETRMKEGALKSENRVVSLANRASLGEIIDPSLDNELCRQLNSSLLADIKIA